MAEDNVYKHLSAGTKLEQVEDDADGRHLASGAGTEDFALFNASDEIVNKTKVSAMGILLKGGNLNLISTVTGWAEAVTGSGVTNQGIADMWVSTGTTVSSSALLRTHIRLMAGAVGDFRRINFDKKIYFFCKLQQRPNVFDHTIRVQLKEANTIGQLAEQGFGVQIDNDAVSGESYGASRGTTSLGVTLTTDREYQLMIIHYPGDKIEWYINNVLKATQSTGANIPSGISGALGYVVFSASNVLVNSQIQQHLSEIILFQER